MNEAEAVLIGKPDIDEYDIGVEVLGVGQGALAIGRLAYYEDLIGRLEYLARTNAHILVVIY